MHRRTFALAGLSATALPYAASAQAWPQRAITISVPFSAGGPTDTIARILAARMTPILGQQIVVENVTGAAGTIGVGKVARAAPDGYTIGIGHWSTHVVNGAIYALPYHLLDDFVPVALVASNPQLVIARKDLPANSLQDLIAWVRANQGKVTAGTAGVGSASHIGGIYFEKLSGTSLTFIPYRGAGPAMQDLLAGQFDLMLDQTANSLPQVRGGRIKAFAVTARKRTPAAPEIPTVDEAGLPGFYVTTWHGMWAPRGTPAAVIERLNAAAREALATERVKQRFDDLGQDIPPPEMQTVAALAAFQKTEVERWTPLLRAANLKTD